VVTSDGKGKLATYDQAGLVDGSIKIDHLPNSKTFVYDVHDGKMIYNLLQHSLWNGKNHPFLLCKCKRNDGLDNPNHKCSMFSNEDNLNYSNRAKR